MPNIGSVTSYFPTVFENTVTMTLNGTIAPGATTVNVNGMTNYSNGQIVVFTIDAATPTLKQVFTGTVSGTSVVNVVWTYGTNQTHTSGASIIDYVSATTMDMVTTGILKSLNQNGSLSSTAVLTALGQGATTGAGWQTLGNTPSTITANGNRSYTCVINSTDLTNALSPGMRLQLTRTVTAPTKSTSLNGSTQYYSKTSPAGMTFTNFPVGSAWIKATSYAAGSIESRYNGTSGWDFALNASGQIVLTGFNGGSTNINSVTSYQSVPLNKWVHVAAELDMSTSTLDGTHSYVMIDGVNVPAFKTSGGSAPTALIQAGNLEIGSRNGGTNPFPGKLAQVAIYSAAVTQANILATMAQSLVGTETSLISAYSFNNTINDLNANANNLTANGSAVATNADTPFTQTNGLTGYTVGTTNYGIITSASFSTNTTLTVQVPEGCTIPTSGGVSAVSYSTQKTPYLFPGLTDKWLIYWALGASGGGAGTGTSYLQSTVGNIQVTIPIGSWDVSPYLNFTVTGTDGYVALSTSTNSVSDTDLSARFYNSASTTRIVTPVIPTKPITLSAATVYYGILNPTGGTSAGFRGKTDDATQFASIYIRNAYL